MRLIDANLLLYASIPELPGHAKARPWLEDVLLNEPRVALPWPALLAFLRISTNPRIFERAARIGDALDRIEAWLALDNTWVPSPGPEHGALLSRLLRQVGAGADLVPDAHLAALALEHGLIVCSTDTDFARFAEVKWENPLLE